jgi:hypothetical protein
MLKRLGILLSLQASFFAVILGYDQLTKSGVQEFLDQMGWNITLVLIAYWLIPPALLALIGFGITLGNQTYQATYRYYHKFLIRRFELPSLGELTTKIERAEKRGLLSHEESGFLKKAILALIPIDFIVLIFLDNPAEWVRKYRIKDSFSSRPNYIQIMGIVFPVFDSESDYENSLKRLSSAHLILQEEVDTVISKGEQLQPITTPIGHKVVYLIKDEKATEL